jgi:putative transposase
MGRPHRLTPGGYVYHVLNRANAGLTLFHEDADYLAFELVLGQALERVPGVRLLTYCLMPDHWHLVLWPRGDGQLSAFGHWLTLTHTQRWHTCHPEAGRGHLYQGRYKSFPVEQDVHFLHLCRYVERNALRAGFVRRAETWRWCGLWHRQQAERPSPWLLTDWPVTPGPGWLREVNRAQKAAELAGLQLCVRRGRPYGAEAWCRRSAHRLGLESTLRPRGRPRKAPAAKTQHGS